MIVRYQRAEARFFKVLAAELPRLREISPPRVVRVKMDGQELSVTYAPLSLRARTAKPDQSGSRVTDQRLVLTYVRVWAAGQMSY